VSDATAEVDGAPGGAHIDCAKEHPLGVLTRDPHLGLGADLGPHRPKRWEQPQERPVGEQHHVLRLEPVLQAADEPPFLAPTCAARSR
jgi:hypothetical protein